MDIRNEMWSEFVCVNPITFSVSLDDMSGDELTIRLLSCQTDVNLDEDNKLFFSKMCGGRRDRGRMVVGFTTTCAISAYHH